MSGEMVGGEKGYVTLNSPTTQLFQLFCLKWRKKPVVSHL